MTKEFLNDEENQILEQTLKEEGVSIDDLNEGGFWRFWSYKELQLDGNFKLKELQGLVKAMEGMEKAHKKGEK
jgi:hypothetical protein